MGFALCLGGAQERPGGAAGLDGLDGFEVLVTLKNTFEHLGPYCLTKNTRFKGLEVEGKHHRLQRHGLLTSWDV